MSRKVLTTDQAFTLGSISYLLFAVFIGKLQKLERQQALSRSLKPTDEMRAQWAADAERSREQYVETLAKGVQEGLRRHYAPKVSAEGQAL